jgi:hypothetical protein
MQGAEKKGQQVISRVDFSEDLVVVSVNVRTIGRFTDLHRGQQILSFPTGVHFSMVVLKHF